MSSSPAPSQVPKEFDPDITSPVWITRRLLLAGVRKYADQLTGRLLDFGCGAKPYRSLFSVPEYVGVDFQGDGHDHTNEAIDVFYDGKVLPFGDASFDSVFSTEVFEHIFNLPEILREIHRVLKPGGRLLVTCPFAICEHEAPNDFARYTSFAIRHLLEQHGFEILQQEKLGSAQEALWQMRIVYWNWHVLSLVRNVRGVRTVARLALNVAMNVAAVVSDRILPRAQDLYLNNLVLARKR